MLHNIVILWSYISCAALAFIPNKFGRLNYLLPKKNCNNRLKLISLTASEVTFSVIYFAFDQRSPRTLRSFRNDWLKWRHNITTNARNCCSWWACLSLRYIAIPCVCLLILISCKQDIFKTTCLSNWSSVKDFHTEGTGSRAECGQKWTRGKGFRWKQTSALHM